MLAAEATHRDHAIVEQVIAELKNGPLAHLPSGVFTANAAWLACAAIAHNLTRAAGALAGGRHARTRTATLRTQLIHTPARIAHSAHRQVLHLPRDWPWEARAGRAVPPRPARPPPHRRLTTAPTGPTGDHQWKSRTDRQLNHAHRPHSLDKINRRQPQRSTVVPGSGRHEALAARRHAPAAAR